VQVSTRRHTQIARIFTAQNSRSLFSAFFLVDSVEKTLVSRYTFADSEFPVAERVVVGLVSCLLIVCF
jgi:hypothetical protein